jgi:hypothetical protein
MTMRNGRHDELVGLRRFLKASQSIHHCRWRSDDLAGDAVVHQRLVVRRPLAA